MQLVRWKCKFTGLALKVFFHLIKEREAFCKTQSLHFCKCLKLCGCSQAIRKSTGHPLILFHFSTGGLDLIFMPGLGFDKKGNRLGRGKGYYDTYLERCMKHPRGKPYTIALAFKEQICESVPVAENDVQVDEILYEDCWNYLDSNLPSEWPRSINHDFLIVICYFGSNEIHYLCLNKKTPQCKCGNSEDRIDLLLISKYLVWILTLESTETRTCDFITVSTISSHRTFEE